MTRRARTVVRAGDNLELENNSEVTLPDGRKVLVTTVTKMRFERGVGLTLLAHIEMDSKGELQS
jgi:hypothetical protein